MKIIRRPKTKDLNLAVTILSDSIEGLNPETLLKALKAESVDIQISNKAARLLTYSEVAERLSCSKRHIQYLCEKGEIKTRKIGQRAIRIAEKDLVAFVEK